MRKINKKIIALAAISLFALVGCNDEIKAQPTDYKDAIVTVNGNKDIVNNYMEKVYDKIRKGGIGEDSLKEILFMFAKSVVGDYEELKTAANGSDAQKDAFVAKYSSYKAEEDGQEDKVTERARVDAKFATIEKRIKEKLYDEISAAVDSRNIYSEENYLRGLKANMYDVNLTLQAGDSFYKGIIDVKYEKEDIFSDEAKFLHRSCVEGYIKDQLLPDIYRQLLVEQYILDRSYNSLGRSFAREVNVLTITANSDHVKTAPYLMNYYVNNKIEAGAYATAEEVLNSFKTISNIWKGVNLTADEQQFALDSGAFTLRDGYLVESEYGDLMSKYNLINDNPRLNDTEQESTFTAGNKYPKEVGLELKQREIELHDYTTTGWFIKNGGLTTLPDAIRNRLFNINVANAVNELSKKSLSATEKAKYDRHSATYEKDYNSSVALINGVFYLKSSAQSGESKNSDVLFYNQESSTYYVIQISEAVSSSRLDVNSSDRYELIRDNGSVVMENIVNEVNNLVANSESYKTLSTAYWLEQSELAYHDQTIYDYFVSNYPDLFD